MELRIDLLKQKKKSHIRMAFGVLCLLLAGTWIIIGFSGRETQPPFLWVFQGLLFTLMGMLHIVEGLGYSIGRLFGKAHIFIDSESILLKTGVFDKKQLINWSEIKSMDYKPNKFKIKTIDNASKVLNLSMLDYMLIREIKTIINCIAKEKNILITEIDASKVNINN